jgi:two-component system OmpR family response regulator
MREEKILIVDDERDIVDFVRAYLEKEGYPTLEAYDGESALELWREHRPDLIVLDVLMPNLDGLEFCRRVRKESAVPIIILSAMTGEDDRLTGLDFGADDYVVKPFSPRELVARIRAVLRRHRMAAEERGRITAGPMSIDSEGYRVCVGDNEISFTPMELSILTVLASHPGRVFSREELIVMAMSDDYDGYDRNVDTHVKNIRRKVREAARDWSFIETVYGAGYRFEAKENT